MKKKKVTRGGKNSTSKISPIRFRPELFWDVDPKTIDPDKHAKYIIERILDFGRDAEVRWMWNRYTRSRIRDVVLHSRVLHKQTRPLWELLTKK